MMMGWRGTIFGVALLGVGAFAGAYILMMALAISYPSPYGPSVHMGEGAGNSPNNQQNTQAAPDAPAFASVTAAEGAAGQTTNAGNERYNAGKENGEGNELHIVGVGIHDWLIIVFTGLLFGVGALQTCQLRRTNDHAETVERPWIFVEIAPHLIPMPDGADHGTYGAFYICNYGRGPATIRECSEICYVGQQPAAAALSPSRLCVIGPNQRTTLQKMEPLIDVRNAGVNVDLSAEADEQKVYYLPSERYDGDWFFKIIVKYDGITTKGRQSAYCWRFDRGLGHWVEYGGSNHNYQT
jgi:hypothetical protein